MKARPVSYPLSPKYIPNWTVVEAIRELIANAFDTETPVSVLVTNPGVTIKDNAKGIPKSYWVLGEGTHGAIGQFGEGLKMAMLVLAREHRYVKLETKGYSVTPKTGYSDEYDTETLILNFDETEGREEGTAIHVECYHKELMCAKSLFLKLEPKEDLGDGIINEPGSLYINGVWVQYSDLVWGYNFTDKELANRDRSVLDAEKVRDCIRESLAKTSSDKVVTAILKEAVNSRTQKLECITFFRPVRREAQEAWYNSFYNIFGQNACLSSNVNANLDKDIEDRGYKVVKGLPMSIKQALVHAGIENADDIQHRLMQEEPALLTRPLTAFEAQTFEDAIRVAEKVVPPSITQVQKTVIAESFPGDSFSEDFEQYGLYKEGVVYLHKKCLENFRVAVGTLIHERLHGLGFHDNTRDLEFAQARIIGDLATQISTTEPTHFEWYVPYGRRV